MPLEPQVSYDYIKQRFEPDIEEERFAVFKDVNFAALWDTRDYDYAHKLFRKIETAEEERSTDLAENYELKLIRMLDGQYVQDTPTDPKPLQAAIKLDVITNNGLVRIISILIGKTNIRFTHYASGDGATIATVGNTALQSEKFRISMATDGFRTAAGTVGRYGAVFIPSAPSHTVAEAGVVDQATGGTFLNRTLYASAQRIVHTIFLDFFTLSIALYSSAI